MNKTRSLFLVPLFLLAGLFAVNSYADEVTISWEDGTYTGEVSNGVPDGQGTLTFADGRKYVGEWNDGRHHGQGALTSPDGYKYVGQFKNDSFHGQGPLTRHDG